MTISPSSISVNDIPLYLITRSHIFIYIIVDIKCGQDDKRIHKINQLAQLNVNILTQQKSLAYYNIHVCSRKEKVLI